MVSMDWTPQDFSPPGCLRVKQKLYFVCSHSWRTCAPHLPEGVLPAVTGRSLSRRRFCNRKLTVRSFISIPSLRKTPSSAATAIRLQLGLGKMDPDHPLTAHLLAAAETQVRPQVQPVLCFCLSLAVFQGNRSVLQVLVMKLWWLWDDSIRKFSEHSNMKELDVTGVDLKTD